MIKMQLVEAMERYKKDRSLSRVIVNAEGHRGFSDVDGEFFLMGFNQCFLIRNGKATTTYIGAIARRPDGHIRYINAGYLESI